MKRPASSAKACDHLPKSGRYLVSLAWSIFAFAGEKKEKREEKERKRKEKKKKKRGGGESNLLFCIDIIVA